MQCDNFDAGACRSCTLMGIPYAAQLAQLDASVRAALGSMVPESAWEPIVSGPESGFRNKAKLVVGGRRGAPTLGILDPAGRGVDLRHCGLYEPGLRAALPTLAGFVADTELTPYDLPRRTGELKGLIVTHSPDGELMIRFVMRSPGQLPKLQRALPTLMARLPNTRVVSVNLLPDHVALVEGPQESLLSGDTLPMRLRHNGTAPETAATGDTADDSAEAAVEVTLHLRPGSFFQTNTRIATALYGVARSWVDPLEPEDVWDLYCGVGGFALHLADQQRRVTGVEISAEAIRSAQRSAAELGLPRDRVGFRVGDAAAYLDEGPSPQLVVVNPPRRGIGAGLADWLQTQGPRPQWLLYSSCNAVSLATDLARLPAFRVCRARVFAMFPQTRHHEVLVLARRDRSVAST